MSRALPCDLDAVVEAAERLRAAGVRTLTVGDFAITLAPPMPRPVAPATTTAEDEAVREYLALREDLEDQFAHVGGPPPDIIAEFDRLHPAPRPRRGDR